MSQWILKSALDSIPVSFEQLALLLADGGICETDLVRAENNENWQYVDSVVGLCRAAENLRSSKAPSDSSRDRILEVEVDPTNASKVTTPKTSGAVSNAAEPGSTPDSMTQTIVAVPAQPLSWRRVTLFCLGFGIVGWCGWLYWFESNRFPKPAHMSKNSEPFTLPWIGAVTSFEAILLGVDTVAIVTFAVWRFRWRQRAK